MGKVEYLKGEFEGEHSDQETFCRVNEDGSSTALKRSVSMFQLKPEFGGQHVRGKFVTGRSRSARQRCTLSATVDPRPRKYFTPRWQKCR
jgi:hypothetical protein